MLNLNDIRQKKADGKTQAKYLSIIKDQNNFFFPCAQQKIFTANNYALNSHIIYKPTPKIRQIHNLTFKSHLNGFQPPQCNSLITLAANVKENHTFSQQNNKQMADSTFIQPQQIEILQNEKNQEISQINTTTSKQITPVVYDLESEEQSSTNQNQSDSYDQELGEIRKRKSKISNAHKKIIFELSQEYTIQYINLIPKLKQHPQFQNINAIQMKRIRSHYNHAFLRKNNIKPFQNNENLVLQSIFPSSLDGKIVDQLVKIIKTHAQKNILLALSSYYVKCIQNKTEQSNTTVKLPQNARQFNQVIEFLSSYMELSQIETISHLLSNY